MPSSNKTPELGLNQWGPGDKPKWADHNADNAIVSAAVGNLSLLDTTDKTSLVAAANEIKNIRAALAPPRGRYDTYELLKAAHPTGEAGEAYLVGAGADLYIWDVDQADWIPAGNLQGVPGPNEITTATATPISGVLVGEGGTVREGVAGEDFAAGEHPHGSITYDGKVGTAAGLPLFTGEGGAVGTKTAAEAITTLGAQRGGIFSGTPVLSRTVYTTAAGGGDALIFARVADMVAEGFGIFYMTSYAKKRVRCMKLSATGGTLFSMTVENTTENGSVTFATEYSSGLQLLVLPLSNQFTWVIT